MRPTHKTLEESFWEKVETIPEHPCYEWIRAKNARGYGEIRHMGKRLLAHRAAWLVKYGKLPEDLCLCHKCDNPGCVRVEHLFLGSIADNNADMRQKGRQKIPSPKPGEANYMAKLTRRDVLRIRRRCTSKRGAKTAIAKEYGVTLTLISMICRRQIWKHV